MTYTKKLESLSPWFPRIIEDVKKDLKQDHLSKDKAFAKNYLGNKPIARLTLEDLVQAYKKVIQDGAENVAEFIAVRWLLKNGDLYQHFESELTKITPDFDKLEVLDDASGKKIIDNSVKAYGAVPSYIFSLLNSVVFNESQLNHLRELALNEQVSFEKQAEVLEEKASFDQLKLRYETDIQRVVDKYEKKLSGLQRKYIQDTETFKKQISGLQRKLQEQ